MPVKYVDEATGELIPEIMSQTGAPSAYGVKTPEDLVATSMGLENTGKSNVFFNKR